MLQQPARKLRKRCRWYKFVSIVVVLVINQVYAFNANRLKNWLCFSLCLIKFMFFLFWYKKNWLLFRNFTILGNMIDKVADFFLWDLNNNVKIATVLELLIYWLKTFLRFLFQMLIFLVIKRDAFTSFANIENNCLMFVGNCLLLITWMVTD